MTRSKHTPGPWVTDMGEVPILNNERALTVVRENHVIGEIEPSVCIIGRRKILDESDYANANLIAAAPELLEALRECAEMLMEVRTGENIECECREAANEAFELIKKVTREKSTTSAPGTTRPNDHADATG